MTDRKKLILQFGLTSCLLQIFILSCSADPSIPVGKCGIADPSRVDQIPIAIVRFSTTSQVIIDWVAPSGVPSLWNYFYELSCPSCKVSQADTADETYTFTGLDAATEYTVLLRAGHRNCQLSQPFVLQARTALNNLREPLRFSDIRETSFRVHWAKSSDVGVRYEVSCAGVVDGTSVVCQNLQSGDRIHVTVRTVKAGFPKSSSIHGAALTKLFAIDANAAQYELYETGISVAWQASNTAGVTYRLTCRRVGLSSDVVSVASTVPMAACEHLETGQEYHLSVTVKKEGGFDDTVTELGNQLFWPWPRTTWADSTTEIETTSTTQTDPGTTSTAETDPATTSTAETVAATTSTAETDTTSTSETDAATTSTSTTISITEEESETEKSTEQTTTIESSTTHPETTKPDENRGSCPSEDWLQFSDFCYLLVKGSNGRTLSEAVSDCQRRDSSAHLLWVTSQAEMDWVTDYSARNWRLREDYRAQCKNCRFHGDAAWTGLYRDVADGGKFKWLRDSSAVNVSVEWLVGPSQPPMNFGFLYDAQPRLLWRTYQPGARHFHLCKAPRRRRPPFDSAEPLENARDAAETSTGRCPPPLVALQPNLKESTVCVLTVRAVSHRLALAECRRRALGSELLSGWRGGFVEASASRSGVGFHGNNGVSSRRRLRTFMCGVSRASQPRPAASQSGCVVPAESRLLTALLLSALIFVQF